ncbi:Ig-like domain repeat protein [Brucepastera parasyntrophica]|uniref:Ig-like domain repeat protein n=1 Tax=Brucepastera parasyntrophica TaxID=2880008 RepID=UPI00210E0CE9|nr:Ig-like domain repeat protein [Brucepastera parasyntrophica]ULQ59093.1 Ig-like domain repeat protein [Brucepastera parasyntrophica]
MYGLFRKYAVYLFVFMILSSYTVHAFGSSDKPSPPDFSEDTESYGRVICYNELASSGGKLRLYVKASNLYTTGGPVYVKGSPTLTIQTLLSAVPRATSSSQLIRTNIHISVYNDETNALMMSRTYRAEDAYSLGTSTVSYTLPGDEKKMRVEVYMFDTSDYREYGQYEDRPFNEYSLIRYIVRDNEPPEIRGTFMGNNGRPWFGPLCELSFYIYEDGVGYRHDLMEVTVNDRYVNGEWTVGHPNPITFQSEYSNGYAFSIETYGTYTLTVKDLLGNESSATVNIVDIRKPMITVKTSDQQIHEFSSTNADNNILILEPAKAASFKTTVADYTLADSGTDPLKSKYMQEIWYGDGTKSEPRTVIFGTMTDAAYDELNNISFDIAVEKAVGVPSGLYEWTIHARDYAGNGAAPVMVKQLVLVNGPAVRSQTETKDSGSGWITGLYIRGEDDAANGFPVNKIDGESVNVGDVSVWYRLDGSEDWHELSEISTGSKDWNGKDYMRLSGAPDGEHEIEIKVTDEAGQETEEKIIYKKDEIAPELEVLIDGVNAESGRTYYINDPSRIQISYADLDSDRAESGRASGIYQAEYTESETAAPLQSFTGRMSFREDGFTPSEGVKYYNFAVTDHAGNTAAVEGIHLVYDPEGFAQNAVELEVSDDNKDVVRRAGQSYSGAVSGISIRVDGTSQKSSGVERIEWRIFADGSDEESWSGSNILSRGTDTAAAAAAIPPSVIGDVADGVYRIKAVVFDMCGNKTEKMFTVMKDTSVVRPLKEWIVFGANEIAGGRSGYAFSIDADAVPAEEAARIYVKEGEAATGVIWNETYTACEMDGFSGTKYTELYPAPGNGEYTAGEGREGTVTLVSLDRYGNIAERTITIVHAETPDEIVWVKEAIFGADGATFRITVPAAGQVPETALTYASGKYTAAYFMEGANGVLPEKGSIDGDGTVYWERDTSVHAVGGWTPGFLGEIRVWAELYEGSISGDGEAVLIREITGARGELREIENSAPRFRAGPEEWPDYISASTPIGWQLADDPDEHEVRYEIRVEGAGGNVWSSGELESLDLFGPDWNRLRLEMLAADSGNTAGDILEYVRANEIRISLIARDEIAGEDTIGKQYPAGRYDDTAPQVHVGEPWTVNGGQWSQEETFTIKVQDELSGTGTIMYTIRPVTLEEGVYAYDRGRASDARNEVRYEGYEKGSTDAITAEIGSTDMKGMYELTVAVMDIAGNTYTQTFRGSFDQDAPALDRVEIEGSSDSEGSYYADISGGVYVNFIGIANTGSPVTAWYVRQGENGQWKRYTWTGTEQVYVNVIWNEGKTNELLWFKIENAAKKESAAVYAGEVRYDVELPEWNLHVRGYSGEAGGIQYVGDREAVEAEIVFDESVQGEIYEQVWQLVKISEENKIEAVLEGTGWESLRARRNEWEEGAAYQIQAGVMSRSGREQIRKSAVFVIDESAPEAVNIRTIAKEAGRRGYYPKEDFMAEWIGGSDEESPVTRSIYVYQEVGGVRRPLNVIEAGGKDVLIQWGMDEISWGEGVFYLEGRAVNAAGHETVSNRAEITIDMSGTGILVYIPQYADGESPIGLSWEDSARTDGEWYVYEVWEAAEDQSTRRIIRGESEGLEAVVVLPDGFEPQHGTHLYATVTAYTDEEAELRKGVSIPALIDRTSPDLWWQTVAEAASAEYVGGRYESEDEESGIQRVEWLAEKRSEEIDAESGLRYWEIIKDSETEQWQVAGEGGEGSVAADVQGIAETGELVRLAVRAENGAGRYTEIRSSAIMIDNSPPPAPVVLDQGDVINHTKQSLEVNWRLSRIDGESGLERYEWGWFYAGEGGPVQWNELEKDASGNIDEYAEAYLGNAGVNGRTVIFAVKAVNKAGLSTTGYSDGIILDENAPYIHRIEVYSDANYRDLCEGYIRNGSITGNTVYLKIAANEEESWMSDGYVQAYKVDTQGQKKAHGEAVVLREAGYGYFAAINLGEECAGKSWIFEAEISDGAGNVSNRAVSSGFTLEKEIGAIENFAVGFDILSIHADWDSAVSDEQTYIRGYLVTVSSKNELLASREVTIPAASFIWGEKGFNLPNGTEVTIAVRSVSYAGSLSEERRSSITVDINPPVYAKILQQIPSIAGATHWYDRISGIAGYGNENATGISAIQWSAVLVPGEHELIGWQEKRGVRIISIEETLENIRDEEPAWWHGKSIRLRFRAANGVGIWSGIESTEAIEIDMTEPEVMTIERESQWTNESETVTGWSIELADSDSGIMRYQALVVKDGKEKEDIDWSTLPAIDIERNSGKGITLTGISVQIEKETEGLYRAVLRVQNGSGRWVVQDGGEVIFDETPPVLLLQEWAETIAGEVTTSGGAAQTVRISNGPDQGYYFLSNEEVRWTISGEGGWLRSYSPEDGAYSEEAEDRFSFGDAAEGFVYVVYITLEDRAGNRTTEAVAIRYNRGPQIRIRDGALVVRPGQPVDISDLVSVSDEEGSGSGDYPLAFTWDPGNGSGIRTWSGGSDGTDVFGGSVHGTVYTHGEAKAQRSEWDGSLRVTDRYGKASEMALPVAVENTRSGTLYVDEYWIGPFELQGIVRIPSGITLTLSNSEVSAGGLIKNGKYESGIIAEPGGTLTIANEGGGISRLMSKSESYAWLGIEVFGRAAGDGFSVSGAERAFTIHGSGLLNGIRFSLNNNVSGLHILGGNVSLEQSEICENTEYGIKEERPGDYVFRALDLSENGVDYYRYDRTVLSAEEIRTIISE